MEDLIAGCNAIVHLGGVSVERPFEEILEANIKGVFNLYEAARRQGVKRVVFASSNHVIGFYGQNEHITTRDQRRPDGYYGLSKSYGEDMAQLYFDRYGIESVSLRIGSAVVQPTDRRGHTVVFGASNNTASWWDNRYAAHLGYHPRDNAEQFRALIEQQPMPAADNPARRYQGGVFTANG
eukprot:gene42250-52484_t